LDAELVEIVGMDDDHSDRAVDAGAEVHLDAQDEVRFLGLPVSDLPVQWRVRMTVLKESTDHEGRPIELAVGVQRQITGIFDGNDFKSCSWIEYMVAWHLAEVGVTEDRQHFVALTRPAVRVEIREGILPIEEDLEWVKPIGGEK
jgi:hypothetical protein